MDFVTENLKQKILSSDDVKHFLASHFSEACAASGTVSYNHDNFQDVDPAQFVKSFLNSLREESSHFLGENIDYTLVESSNRSSTNNFDVTSSSDFPALISSSSSKTKSKIEPIPLATVGKKLSNLRREKINGAYASKQTIDSKYAVNQKENLTVVRSISTNSSREITTELQCMRNDEIFPILMDLADIYAFIISNKIAPSLYSELGLLFSLLSVPSIKEFNQIFDLDTKWYFFRKSEDCHFFALKCIFHLGDLLQNVGPILRKKLASLPILVANYPSLVKKLNAIEDDEEELCIVNGLGVTQKFVSWVESEDNSNNHRHPEQMRLYNNRQLTIDSFASTIREFGRLRKGMDDTGGCYTLRAAALNVILNLDPRNMKWFSEHFMQQLLDIGMAPVEETDEELMALTDKKRLQSLNRRLAEPPRSIHSGSNRENRKNNSVSVKNSDDKHTQKGKNLRAVAFNSNRNSIENQPFIEISKKSTLKWPDSDPVGVLPPKNEAKIKPYSKGRDQSLIESEKKTKCGNSDPNKSPRVKQSVGMSIFNQRIELLVLENFPGGQEFFFKFIRAADSYSLNIHLARTFSKEISLCQKEISDCKILSSRPYISACLARLKTVAKFLGVLHFGTFWVLFEEDTFPLNGLKYSSDCIENSKFLEFVHMALVDAWKNCSLCGIIPWVVDYLCMAQWMDGHLMDPITKILSFLLTIRMKIGMLNTPLSIMVCLEVEKLMESLNLNIDTIQLVKNMQIRKDSKGTVDDIFVFTPKIIQICCPCIMELVSLLDQKDNSDRIGNISASRKVLKTIKPINVTSEIDENEKKNSTIESINASKSSRKVVQQALIDVFFKSNPELQRLVDFCTTNVVNNACEESVTLALSDLANLSDYALEDMNSHAELANNIVANASTSAESIALSRIKPIIELLAPQNINQRVLIAVVNLASQRAAVASRTRTEKLAKLAVERSISQLSKKILKAKLDNFSVESSSKSLQVTLADNFNLDANKTSTEKSFVEESMQKSHKFYSANKNEKSTFERSQELSSSIEECKLILSKLIQLSNDLLLLKPDQSKSLSLKKNIESSIECLDFKLSSFQKSRYKNDDSNLKEDISQDFWISEQYLSIEKDLHTIPAESPLPASFLKKHHVANERSKSMMRSKNMGNDEFKTIEWEIAHFLSFFTEIGRETIRAAARKLRIEHTPECLVSLLIELDPNRDLIEEEWGTVLKKAVYILQRLKFGLSLNDLFLAEQINIWINEQFK